MEQRDRYEEEKVEEVKKIPPPPRNHDDVYDDVEEEVYMEQNGRIPTKFIATGAVALILLIIVATVFFVFKGGGESATQTPTETNPGNTNGLPDITFPGQNMEDILQTTTQASSALNYTREEIELLRNLGYTGQEIEEYSAAGRNASDLADEARTARKKYLQSLYLELKEEALKTGSPEYKELAEMSWVGLNAVELKELGEGSTGIGYTERKENVRYKKVPARGQQLYLKLYFPTTQQVMFMEVSPIQYLKLSETGNIIVSFTEINYGGQIFVINLKEVPLQ